MQKLSIGVVVTNYNSWAIALECVNAHLRYAGGAVEQVILVDDHSDQPYNGPPLDPRIKIIRNPKNLGFVKSVNVGFGGLVTDLVLVFDADAHPLMNYSDAIEEEFSKNGKLGVMGFATYDKDNQLTGSCEPEPGILSLVLGQQMDRLYKKYFRKGTASLVVYSCAMAVRRKAFDEAGGFDENFDWLESDNDFCIRVRRQGWLVTYNPEIKAFHEGGGTPQLASERVLRAYKNRWYLLRKHGKIKNVFLMKMLILSRLRIEYLVLLVCGKLIFKDKRVASDKLWGRKRVIHYCKENYK